MSIFSKIKNAIFGHKEEAPAAAAAPTAAPAIPLGDPAPAPAAPAALSEIDVEASLNAMPGAGDLNWQGSIVDLMKLVGMDSSLTARKQLAAELHYPGDTNDSASMNIWLHKQVMSRMAANGGKLPTDLA